MPAYPPTTKARRFVPPLLLPPDEIGQLGRGHSLTSFVENDYQIIFSIAAPKFVALSRRIICSGSSCRIRAAH
jgi:hypothetical protein